MGCSNDSYRVAVRRRGKGVETFYAVLTSRSPEGEPLVGFTTARTPLGIFTAAEAHKIAKRQRVWWAVVRIEPANVR